MSETGTRAHPYIPNSSPATRAEMLEEIGVAHASDLYDGIPASLKLNRPLNLPPALPSERDLRRHVQGILNKNTHCGDVISFLGGGCLAARYPRRLRRDQLPRRVPDRLRRRHLRRPRQVPGDLRIPEHDRRTGRLRYGQRPGLRLGGRDDQRVDDGCAHHWASQGADRRDRLAGEDGPSRQCRAGAGRRG